MNNKPSGFGPKLQCDCCDKNATSLVTALRAPDLRVFVFGVAGKTEDKTTLYHELVDAGWRVSYICDACTTRD